MKQLLSIVFCLCSLVAFAQQVPKSKNMNYLSSFDNNAYTVSSGVQFNDCWGYVAPDGREYAIFGSTQKVHFFDVTNPYSPVQRAIFTHGATSIWRDYKVYKNYAYGVADQGTEGLYVYNLTDMNNITATQFPAFFNRTHNIFIDTLNARLYAAGSNTQSNGVVVIDISNPATPTLLSNTPLAGGYIHDIYVRNNIAYCSHGTGGMRVYDMTNPATPVQLAVVPQYNGGYQHSSWLNDAGTNIILADETHGVKMRSVGITVNSPISYTLTQTDTFASALLAPTVTNCIPHNPFVEGNNVYISYYHDGVQVFNISNPSNIGAPAAYYDTDTTNTNYSGYKGVWGVYPYLPSGNIIATDVTYGMFMLSHCAAAGCNKPNFLSMTNLTNSGATVNWNPMPCATKYLVAYKVFGTATWTTAYVYPPLNSLSLSGLQSNKKYIWKVRAFCNNAQNSLYAPNQFFTTLAAFNDDPTQDAVMYFDNSNEAALENTLDAIIYPNPSSNFNCELIGFDGDKVAVNVSDLMGRNLLETRFNVENANDIFTLDLTDFNDGLYFVTFRAGDKILTQRIMKQ